MNTLAKAAAAAGSMVAASAVALALVLPAHGTSAGRPAGAATTAAHGPNGGHAGTPGNRAGGSPAGGTGAAGPSGSSGGGSGAGGSGAGEAGIGGAGTGGQSGAGASEASDAGGTGPGTVMSSGSGTSTSTGTGTTMPGTGTGTTTSTSTGPYGLHLPHALNTTLPHLLIPAVTAIPSPSGTIGDPGGPCLQGYVWRHAYPGDYVCVIPATRAQAAADNAAALSRVEPGGGAYGQYTCRPGYVWRQVVPDDYTCVTPAIRAAAAADNAQAASRVALLRLWVTDWTPPSSSTTNCSGAVCSTTEGGRDGPDFQVNGDQFNYGQVQLQIRGNNGALLWWADVNAGAYPGYPGGAFGAHTPIGDCSSDPRTTDNDYVVAYDMVSGRWSNKLPTDSDCASF